MKKNILILLTASYGGGAETDVLDYIKNYDKDKFNVSLITLKKGNIEETFRKICKEQQVIYKCLNSKRILFKLSRFIKENKIQLIHANLIQPEIHAFLAKIFNPKIKIISTKHALNPFKKRLIYKIVARILDSKNDKIIVVSNTLYNFYKNRIGISAEKLKIIYDGINISEFSTKKKQLIRKNDFTIGIVGRLEKVKNHLVLFRAVKKLKELIPNIKLIVIGMGKEENKLKKWVISNNLQNSIKFLGYKENIQDYYKTMDIFCLPSFAEGFGRVNVEALLSNVFVITSNTTGMKEVIRDGKDGLLFNPHNVNDLASKILWVYENPKKSKKMIETGKKHIKDKFDLKKIIKQKEELYSDLTGD